MINFLVQNWQVLVAGAAVIAAAVILIYNFFKQPKSAQLAKVQEWLLWAVTEAEKSFGAGTGILKLRYVYDLFLGRFPSLAKIVSFQAFSLLVDKALEKMKDALSNNKQIQAYVEERKE